MFWIIDGQDQTCDNVACATIYPSGGTAPYKYEWDNNGVILPYTGACDELTAADNTLHTVVVMDDKDYEATASITLLGFLNVFEPGNAAFSEEYCYGEEVDIDIEERVGLSYLWTMQNGDTISTSADLSVFTDLLGVFLAQRI